MELFNNFVSTVVLGRFNPSILTPEFLKKECGEDIEKVDYLVPVDVPVTREFIDTEKQILFFADLERFQVKELKLEDFSKIKGPKIIHQYLECLRYTPIFVCGINFNYDFKINADNKDKLKNFLINEKNLFEVFETDEFRMDTKRKFGKDELTSTYSWEVSFSVNKILKASLRLSLKQDDNEYELNQNLEVDHLYKDRNRINIITQSLEKNITYHDWIIRKFLEGIKDA